jgi:hypothetical protein
MAGTPFDSDRAFQDKMRNTPKVVPNGYSNLASMQPRPQSRCETCGRPVAPEAPGGYCYDCYRTMQFFSKDSTGGEQPGEGILDDKFVTPKIAPGE